MRGGWGGEKDKATGGREDGMWKARGSRGCGRGVCFPPSLLPSFRPAAPPQVPPPAPAPPARLGDPSRAGRPLEPVEAADNDAAIQAIEKRLHCTCGCGLDVYTCRTTDFTCTPSPAGVDVQAAT